MKVLEWNINKRSAKNTLVEPFVCERILSEDADIVCLVEYVEDTGIRTALEPSYWLFESIPSSGNQILLAVKKSFAKEKPTVIRDFDERGCYNFLHIRIKDKSGKDLSLIGVRMLTGSGKNSMNAEKQTPPLNQYLKRLDEEFICVGDYNILDFRMRHWFPDYRMEELWCGKRAIESASYFFPKRDDESRIGAFGALDHILTRADGTLKATAEYNWDFVCDHPIYPAIDDIKADCDWDIEVGFPDHAMLIAEINHIG